MTKPRDYALSEIDAKRLPRWRGGELKSQRMTPPTDPRDLALAEHITVGVVKNVLLLQYLIAHYAGRNLKSIDPVVQKILAIALYQLRFLDRVPASAAVDEAVEQTRRFGRGRAAGFVNAVLRKATREPEPPLAQRGDAVEFARVVLSHPPELFQRLEGLFGTEAALRFCEEDQLEPPTIVRAIVAPDVHPEFANGAGVSITAHEQPNMFVVNGAKRATLADWARRGVAQVQDPTAAAVANHLDLRAGQTVLDRCCGLGTKTLQVAQRVGTGDRVVAMDPAAARCDGLRRLVEQRGIGNVDVHCSEWLAELDGKIPAAFDRMLADVPCSNSGVLPRRPEARYAQSAAALESLAKLQDRILDDSATRVAADGLLVYSTCSIWREENWARVDAFLSRHGDFGLLADKTTLPNRANGVAHYRDGGYVAVLHRK